MRKRLLIILILLVTAPVLLLAWFGYRQINNEAVLAEARQRSLAEVVLRDVSQTAQNYFRQFESRWRDRLLSQQIGVAQFRQLAKSETHVDAFFAISASGARLYPPVDGVLSQDESLFIGQTDSLWQLEELKANSRLLEQATRPALTTQTDSLDSAYEIAPSSARSAESSPSQDDVSLSSGWFSWTWDTERKLAYWVQQGSGNVVGLVIASSRMYADLITMFPAQTQSPQIGYSGKLIDQNGALFHQWGSREPVEGEVAKASLNLSFPLHGWRADYFSKTPNAFSALYLLLALLSVVAALILGAWFFYREHAREMRLASQRVSFVNQVSHELKTPLTNIRMYADLLGDQLEDDDEKPRRFAAVISSEAGRLSRMIGNVLSFARDQREELELHPRMISPSEVIYKSAEAFSQSFAAADLKLQINGDVKELMNLDPDCLEQILANLLSNVEKYARTGTHAAIGFWREVDVLTVEICDDGPGVSSGQGEKIFDAFYRVSSKLTDGVSGSGIGLGISRSLARLHAGDLVLVPKPEGNGGACFRLTLKEQN